MADTMDLEQVNDNVDQLNKKIDFLNENLQRVTIALVGNPLDRDDSGFIGLVKDIQRQVHTNRDNMVQKADYLLLSARVSKIETKLNRAFWVAVGMSVPASVGVWELVRQFLLSTHK